MWPLSLLLFFTVPNCGKRRWERWFMVSFFTATIWIAGLSYIMVWMVSPVRLNQSPPDPFPLNTETVSFKTIKAVFLETSKRFHPFDLCNAAVALEKTLVGRRQRGQNCFSHLQFIFSLIALEMETICPRFVTEWGQVANCIQSVCDKHLKCVFIYIHKSSH